MVAFSLPMEVNFVTKDHDIENAEEQRIIASGGEVRTLAIRAREWIGVGSGGQGQLSMLA